MEDRYEVLDVVARGAMATVWRAQDVRLGRVVAVKRPHATSDDGAIASEFARAARLAAVVTHPNLVTIFDSGSDDTGPYLVMEYVDGPTLAEMGGATGGAAALGTELASGLSALHAAGIVHRDIRPSNILLGPTGTKLTNFATARALDAASRATVTTPRFEAPEVLAGGEPARASDVYSLGAVLSWLSAQTPPDPELASIVDQAMADEPEERPTAATLAERLRKIAPTATTQTSRIVAAPAEPTPPSDDATRLVETVPTPTDPVDPEPAPPRRGRRLAALAAVILAAVIAAIALSGGAEPIPVAGDTTVVDTTATTDVTAPPESNAPETTVAEDEGGVLNTVRIFVTFIRETPRDVLTNSGAEEIISDVTDGVSEAVRGNVEEAQSNLADAVATVQEEIDSQSVVDRAIDLISRLARQLGLDADRVVDPSG